MVESLRDVLGGGGSVEPARYRVVELSTVTDESLEETLNARTAEGWKLDGIHFAMRESSKRPVMAFVIFSRHA